MTSSIKNQPSKHDDFNVLMFKVATFHKVLIGLGSLGTTTKQAYKSKIIILTHQNYQNIDTSLFTNNIDCCQFQPF